MNILFIVPRRKSYYGDYGGPPNHPHVGIAYLSSFLKKNGVNVNILDQGLYLSSKNFFSKIDSFNPDIIGITIYSYSISDSYELISKIKSIHKEIPIVAGGPHVSAVKGQIFKESKVDYAVKGEGEYTILELLDALGCSGNSILYKNINGLIWRNNSKIIENPNRSYIEDLDSLPLPDYYGFEIEKYFYFEYKILPLITSRGCPYSCNYCAVKLSMGKTFRYRSPENVVDEIEYWYNKGWNTFDINDDCFNLKMNRAEHICELIIERKLDIRYQLYNGIRVERISEKFLKKLKDSGCTFISYGCESGNESILKTIRKGCKLEHVRNAVNLTKEIGIKHTVNFIIGHSGENYESAMDSIRFAKSLPSNFVNFSTMIPYPGTDLFDWVKENAKWVIPEEHYLDRISVKQEMPVFETDEFSKNERKKILKKGFNLYEKCVMQFRLGRNLGYVIYMLTRIRIVDSIAKRIVFNSRVGRKIFVFISRKSRI